VDPAFIRPDELPREFLPLRKKIATVEYSSNFFAEKPRSLRVFLRD